MKPNKAFLSASALHDKQLKLFSLTFNITLQPKKNKAVLLLSGQHYTKEIEIDGKKYVNTFYNDTKDTTFVTVTNKLFIKNT